jgi:hypothetical protein
MKYPFKPFPVICLLAIFLKTEAQTNKGMPLAKDMATHFFYNYMTPNNSSFFEFEKKKEGWWVRLFDGMGSGLGTPQLFWDRKHQLYLPLDFPLQNHPDSATVAETFATYERKSFFTKEQMTNYDRDLYKGYQGWEKDVITELEATPPTSDSLWEALAMAYDFYAYGYVMPQDIGQVQDGDPDRTIMHEDTSLPLSRIRKFIYYEQKAFSAYKQISKSNPHYQCAFYDIGWQLNTNRMSTAVTLTWLDADSLSAPFIKEVAYSSAVLKRARQSLQQLPPGSILFTDKDTTTFPIMYLQMKGERKDILVIDNVVFVLKRSIGHLDRIYKGALFAMKPTVYKDSAFQMAMFQEDMRDSGNYRLDTFLSRLYASPDAPGLPPLDSSIGRMYRYFSRNPFILIDPKRAGRFYPEKTVEGRLTFDLSDSYLMPADILTLDIVNTNLLSRHIFFTHPTEHPIFKPFCFRVNPYVYEFIPASTF